MSRAFEWVNGAVERVRRAEMLAETMGAEGRTFKLVSLMYAVLYTEQDLREMEDALRENRRAERERDRDRDRASTLTLEEAIDGGYVQRRGATLAALPCYSWEERPMELRVLVSVPGVGREDPMEVSVALNGVWVRARPTKPVSSVAQVMRNGPHQKAWWMGADARWDVARLVKPEYITWQGRIDCPAFPPSDATVEFDKDNYHLPTLAREDELLILTFAKTGRSLTPPRDDGFGAWVDAAFAALDTARIEAHLQRAESPTHRAVRVLLIDRGRVFRCEEVPEGPQDQLRAMAIALRLALCDLLRAREEDGQRPLPALDCLVAGFPET